LLLEAAFSGNFASQATVSRQVNVLPRQYSALPGGTPPVTNSTLVGQVANPMAGLIPTNSSLNGSTISYQNLLCPYPELGTLAEQYRPPGTSLCNSLQLTAAKRFSSGLQGRCSFTWRLTRTRAGTGSLATCFCRLRNAARAPPSRSSAPIRPCCLQACRGLCAWWPGRAERPPVSQRAPRQNWNHTT
jgi:hypothetical protein